MCAEKTLCLTRHVPRELEHLRPRGEDAHSVSAMLLSYGTPPRARRRQEADLATDALRGNTSAYAEKTADADPGRRRSREHLRVRGEDTF